MIDLDNVWQWLGFNQKVKAKLLLEKNFILEKDYKHLLSLQGKQKEDGRGGHNKETFLLNIQTFKLLCIKADTKKANEIHEYFIKLEDLLQQIVMEESNELKLQLDQIQQQSIQQEQSFDNRVQIEKQNLLLRQFNSNINIVYIIRVKQYENGEYIIKIGESRRGIEGRFQEHRHHYEDILLLDCFAVKKCKDFERFLHTNDNIRLHNVTDLIGHESERELFRIGRGFTYQSLLKIIQSNLSRFNEIDEKYFEDVLSSIISKVNTQNIPSNQQTILQEILQNQQQMLHQIQLLEKQIHDIKETQRTTQPRTTTNFNTPLSTLGPRLQEINPDTMTLHKVYESVAECINLHHHKLKRPSIDKAVKEHTIYHGYRWNYVDRDQDPKNLHNLVATKVTRPQNIGYIAQLNQDKTCIIKVYLDRKTAAVANGYSISGIDTHVKKGSITHGHYYILYDQCPDELIQVFEERHGGNPILYKDGVGQFDSQNNLIQEFVCKYDCIKQLKISDKTLAKSLDKDVLYNQYYFRSMGNKLVVPPEQN